MAGCLADGRPSLQPLNLLQLSSPPALLPESSRIAKSTMFFCVPCPHFVLVLGGRVLVFPVAFATGVSAQIPSICVDPRPRFVGWLPLALPLYRLWGYKFLCFLVTPVFHPLIRFPAVIGNHGPCFVILAPFGNIIPSAALFGYDHV